MLISNILQNGKMSTFRWLIKTYCKKTFATMLMLYEYDNNSKGKWKHLLLLNNDDKLMKSLYLSYFQPFHLLHLCCVLCVVCYVQNEIQNKLNAIILMKALNDSCRRLNTLSTAHIIIQNQNSHYSNFRILYIRWGDKITGCWLSMFDD